MKYQYRLVKITPTRMTKREIKEEGFDHHEHLSGAIHTYIVDVLIQRLEDKKDLGVYSINLYPFNRYGIVRPDSSEKMKKFYRSFLSPKDNPSEKEKEDTILAYFLLELRKNLEKTFYKFNTFEDGGEKIHISL